MAFGRKSSIEHKVEIDPESLERLEALTERVTNLMSELGTATRKAEQALANLRAATAKAQDVQRRSGRPQGW